jgi:hypothetical protein
MTNDNIAFKVLKELTGHGLKYLYSSTITNCISEVVEKNRLTISVEDKAEVKKLVEDALRNIYDC